MLVRVNAIFNTWGVILDEGRIGGLLWARVTYPTLSTFPAAGNRSTRRKHTTFGRALTILFSHEDWVQVHLTGDRTWNLRGERRVV